VLVGGPRIRPRSVAELSCTFYVSHLVLSVGSGTVDRHGRVIGVREGVDHGAGPGVAARRSQGRGMPMVVDRHRIGRNTAPAVALLCRRPIPACAAPNHVDRSGGPRAEQQRAAFPRRNRRHLRLRNRHRVSTGAPRVAGRAQLGGDAARTQPHRPSARRVAHAARTPTMSTHPLSQAAFSAGCDTGVPQRRRGVLHSRTRVWCQVV